jgi:hypothetical protein
MKVLVSDTSVLIDLERGGFLEAAFSLSWELAVPDLLYENELHNHGGERLTALGLIVAELAPDEIIAALNYRRQQAALSLADTFALSLAASRAWTLLTGDGRLRDLARSEQVSCHGVLWMLDQLHEVKAIPAGALHSGLTTIATHPRCRLPKKDIAVRLERFCVA